MPSKLPETEAMALPEKTAPSAGLRTENAAVINGDVVGYSRLIADNEIETHQTLQAFRSIIEGVVSGEQGEVVVFVGDEFLSILPSAAGALTSAIAIQRILAVENERLPATRRMRFRLGVNVGPVFVEDGRWFGDAINVAARLQALAEPGGICASAAAVEGVEGLPGRLRSLGQKRLRNIPEPVLAYQIVDDELVGEEEARPWRRRIVASERPSLAVSPFVNLGEPDDEHFAQGLMMALTIELMTIPGLDVVSDMSTLRYRGQAHSAQQLSHELGVRFVLEGAVQRSGERVRVMTQLLDVEQGTVGWADQFEVALENVLGAQDEIVAKIVAALDIEVIGGEAARAFRERLDGDAVEVIYRGLHETSLGTADSLRRAAERFADVNVRHPDYAEGYALTALTHFLVAVRGLVDDPADDYARAAELAEKAIDLGDWTGIGYTVLAHVRVLAHDWEGALEAASMATDQRPACDLAFGVAASVMRYLGRWEEAVDLASRAIRLSPLMSDWYRTTLAGALFVGEDYEIAADTAEDVVARNESNAEALLTLAASQAALGRNKHAAAALAHARQVTPSLTASGLRETLPFRDEETKNRLLEKLQQAGLD